MSQITVDNSYCCVPQCRSKGSEVPRPSFHRFPKENDISSKIRRQEWIRILRIGKKVTNRMVVCGKHFQPSDFFARGEGSLSRTKLKKNAVPSLNCPRTSCDNAEKLQKKKEISLQRLERKNKRDRRKEESMPLAAAVMPVANALAPNHESNSVHNLSNDIFLAAEALMTMNSKKKKDVATQVTTADLNICESVGTQVVSGDLIVSRPFIEKLTTNGLKTLTGLYSFSLLDTLVKLLENDYGQSLNCHKMPLKHQIILSMMRLKLDLTFSSLAVFFEYGDSTIKNIFTDIIKHLSVHLKCAIVWLSKETIQEQMPRCFAPYKNTRIVLDCTEIPVTKPDCAKCKIMTFSQYKSDHTIKVMVGIAPNGLVTFISSVFGGRASDRNIFDYCRLIEFLEPHEDAVMVDKGFLIEDICHEHFIKVIRPPFLRQKKQFSKMEAQLNTRIARARVHVERMIQRIKIHKIFKGRLPWGLMPYINDIFTICSGLANLGKPILGDDKF